MLSNLKNIADRVNNLDAKQEFSLQSIDIERIVPNNKNIYGIRNIEELAEDIKINGLYHNLVVKPQGENFVIISGERRYQALKILGYKKVPCQVRNNVTEIDSEIMLIQANAKTRELTNQEKMKQVERLKDLYEQKRKTGDNLKGKTRDIIGKDLGLSGSQVGKYEKINKDLIAPLKEMFEKNNLDMAKAADIASLNEDGQQSIYELLKGPIELNRDELNKLKKVLKDNENQYNLQKDIYTKEFKTEYDRMKKEAEKASKDIADLKAQKQHSEENLAKDDIAGAHSEHPKEKSLENIKNIEFNAEMYVLIKNLKDAAQMFIIKDANKGKEINLNDKNHEILRNLIENQFKFISEKYSF